MPPPGDAKWLDQIAAIAVVRGLSIAAAESLTAGGVQALLASRSGASEWFVGGVTAYNLNQKATLLRVDREHAAACGCVSQRVADEMAENCRRLFAADLAVATTGYAEPNAKQRVAKPYAHLALASRRGVERQIEVDLTAGDRRSNQQACAWAAIEMLALHLQAVDP